MDLAAIGADFPHLVIRQLAETSMRAVVLGSPALGYTISHIVFLCASAQVIRVNAPWMIATMHDYLARRDRPVVQLPRDTVS